VKVLIASSIVLATAAHTGAALAPRLQIEGTAPLVVAGRGFGPSERVTLRISGGNVPRLLRADENGSFRIRLGALRIIRCSSLIVTAAGASGHAAFAHLPRTACITTPRDTSTK
jgi:hypothetical protein